MRNRMKRKRLVALLMGTSPAHVRELAQGVAQFNREHGHWIIRFESHRMDEPPPKWLKTWKGDGILVRVGNRRLAAAVLETGVPAVAFRWAVPTPGIPAIGTDHHAVAEMAAAHLRERGFRHFAACGPAPGVQAPLDERVNAFARVVGGLGFPCGVFQAKPGRTWEQEQAEIVRWLKSLPRPVGIMACNDERGLQVLNACYRAGIPVPEQVAVLGAGNDDCLCSLSHPPLSSMDLAPRRIGCDAAALLERMMDGKCVAAPETLIPPLRVVTRHSTDVLATGDQSVQRAAAFIRSHACDGIHLCDVLDHVKLSRSALERRLKLVLGRTIHQEIRRAQLERVKELLTRSNLPIKQIATQTGFHYLSYLTRAFGHATGRTPAQYRRQARNPAGANC